MADRKRTVSTEYTAKDAGFSTAVSKIASTFESGAKRVERFRDKVSEFRREQGLTTLAALGLGYGIGSWLEKIKEANAEFGRNQKGIAGILASSLAFENGTSEIERYNRSLALSKGITQDLDDTAARFNMQLDDTATSYKSVMSATGSLGLSQKQVMGLTEESLATAKRFGEGGERAATAIARALQTGTVRGFEPFDIKLRSVLGNMRKLTQAQRFEHIERALKGSMQIADAMSGGIGGSLARAQHVVQDLLRNATGPLFGEISKSLAEWATHIKEVGESGKSIVTSFSEKLVKGFQILKDTSRYIKEHWVSIGAVFVAIKGADLAKQWGASLKGIGAGMEGGLGAGLGGFGTGLAKLGAGILPVLGALAAFKVGLDAVTDMINKWQDKRVNEQVKSFGVGSQLAILSHLGSIGALTSGQQKIGQETVEKLRKAGVVSGTKFDLGALAESIGNRSLEERRKMASDFGVKGTFFNEGAARLDQLADKLAQKFAPLVSSLGGPGTVTAATDDKNIKFAKQINNFNGGIHITQKFEDQDPDRVFLRFVSDLERQATSRTQAVTAEALGR